MINTNLQNSIHFHPFNENELLNGIYIVVLHATRVPPHIGLIIHKEYHSLTIKGHDIHIPIKALIKNVSQRKIPSLFIKIKSHTTFSNAYMQEHFILNVQQFLRVDKNIATCLSPIKLFFEEVYGVPMTSVNFLFDLLPSLQARELVEHAVSLFIDEITYTLPIYSAKKLDEEIEKVRKEFGYLSSEFSETNASKPILKS